MDNLLNSPHIDRLIDLALEEDIGPGDVTTQAVVDPELQGEAHIRAKAALVAAGLPVAARVFSPRSQAVLGNALPTKA